MNNHNLRYFKPISINNPNSSASSSKKQMMNKLKSTQVANTMPKKGKLKIFDCKDLIYKPNYKSGKMNQKLQNMNFRAIKRKMNRKYSSFKKDNVMKRQASKEKYRNNSKARETNRLN